MYRYHAFFSYKRNKLTDDWHFHLLEHIRYWVSQELAMSDVDIFFDSSSIGNGLQFDNAISEALNRSKVLISIFSPLYFDSAHCMAEITTFMNREDQLRKPRGTLIACANYYDGSTYPPPFVTMQSEDFTTFASTAKRFWETEFGLKFEEPIKAFSKKIAAKIRSAPEWIETFPSPVYDENARPVLPRILRPVNYLETKVEQ